MLALRRRNAIGIAKEESKKQRERRKRGAVRPSHRGAREEREKERTADERQSGGIETQSAACLFLPAAPQDVFHPIFQLELAFLEGDFFDLFGF